MLITRRLKSKPVNRLSTRIETFDTGLNSNLWFELQSRAELQPKKNLDRSRLQAF
jgi:hypothetical protein